MVLILISYYFVQATHCLWAPEGSHLKSHDYRSRGKSHQGKWNPIPWKDWVCRIMKFICMNCWQAALCGEKTQEALRPINFWNPLLYRSYWSCLCKFLKLHPHKTTKSGTVSRNGGVLNTSVREQAHLKNRLKKRSNGRFWKHTKSSHVNACYLSLWKQIDCWLQQTCMSRDSCSFHLPAQNLIKCIYIWLPDIHLKLSK